MFVGSNVLFRFGSVFKSPVKKLEVVLSLRGKGCLSFPYYAYYTKSCFDIDPDPVHVNTLVIMCVPL